MFGYGWQHKQAGTEYPKSEMSFRQTITGQTRTDRGFIVVVHRASKRVLISFDWKSVDKRHAKWLHSVDQRTGLHELNPQPYWGFDDLASKLRAKLHNCFYAKAEMKTEKGKKFFRYTEILMLADFSFENFLTAIEVAAVLVDFDARTGHNHGTKFRLRQEWLPELYHSSTQI